MYFFLGSKILNIYLIKSYFEFYSDIYPKTHDITSPGLIASDWLQGFNNPLNKIALDLETKKEVLKKSANLSIEKQIDYIFKIDPVTLQNEGIFNQ